MLFLLIGSCRNLKIPQFHCHFPLLTPIGVSTWLRGTRGLLVDNRGYSKRCAGILPTHLYDCVFKRKITLNAYGFL